MVLLHCILSLFVKTSLPAPVVVVLTDLSRRLLFIL